MNPKVIDTSDAPGAIGPYSQGWIYNGLVFVSGQVLCRTVLSSKPSKAAKT